MKRRKGGMGNECRRLLKHLADKIAQTDTEPYNTAIAYLRTQPGDLVT